jgi:hypothetical protein
VRPSALGIANREVSIHKGFEITEPNGMEMDVSMALFIASVSSLATGKVVQLLTTGVVGPSNAWMFLSDTGPTGLFYVSMG